MSLARCRTQLALTVLCVRLFSNGLFVFCGRDGSAFGLLSLYFQVFCLWPWILNCVCLTLPFVFHSLCPIAVLLPPIRNILLSCFYSPFPLFTREERAHEKTFSSFALESLQALRRTVEDVYDENGRKMEMHLFSNKTGFTRKNRRKKQIHNNSSYTQGDRETCTRESERMM